MSNKTIQQLISDSIDRQLSESEEQRLSVELQKHPEFEKMAEEIRQNKVFCHISSYENPPPLDLSKLKASSKPKKWYHVPARSAWLLPMAAALLLLFFVLMRNGKPDPEPSLADEIQQARLAYGQAIAKLEVRAQARLQELPFYVQVTYRENLVIIDQAIADCQNAILQHSNDTCAYQILSHAFEAKTKLLQSILKT
ncbi:MAG: hypothetical protein CSA81_11005 [Acidobacteria bacterium]|nr:MAG: hypothetical protein CSA81_11005 [Acidobacteriota bacterium]PIE89437.1 MAG: hypothetical protein CR997_11385 [Acidobacteriota bacterium]